MEKPFALIIEDERDIAALFRYVIDMAGYRTELAFHGKEAIERLSNSQPDLVVLDLNLPGVSGHEILQLIRKDKRISHTKVIVITAHAHMASGLSVEPDLIMFKPVSVEQLSNLIDRLHLSDKSIKATRIQENPLDETTGLYKQSFFINRLNFALNQSIETKTYLFAVLLIKLDIKDQPKHQNRESVIREISQSFIGSIRPTDTIALFEQDKIYMLVENIINKNIPIMIANRLEKKLVENIVNIGSVIQIPIRIGILLCDSGYKNHDEILRDAKNALHLAEVQGEEYSKYYYQVSVRK
ncbi:MAG TPA: hypothetical protein DCX53_09165 [Anaerolineae bacterium]|nr:hypothetical protein [Anaerolineae bacterium]